MAEFGPALRPYRLQLQDVDFRGRRPFRVRRVLQSFISQARDSACELAPRSRSQKHRGAQAAASRR